MANYRDASETTRIKSQVLLAAAKLFVAQGYNVTSVQQIAGSSGIHKSTLMYVFKSKDDILAALVQYMLNNQTSTATRLIADQTSDPALIYATEIALKLYTAESRSHIRELYVTAYSLPKTSTLIHQALAEQLKDTMGSYLPNMKAKDYYELELAIGGIVRSFMTVPCDMYFTMERKLHRALESIFLLCRVPDEKIQEALDFVTQFDWASIVQTIIQDTRTFLEKQI